jgi:hypothetical protein
VNISEDSIICLDETDQNIQLDKANFAHGEIELANEADANAIIILSEETYNQSRLGVGNQSDQYRLQTENQRQTKFNNKKFKCVKCHFRSNLLGCMTKHFKIVHWQVAFDRKQCIQVLDEAEATRTLAAYEQNHAGQSVVCKPFKCVLCEYRTTQRPNVYIHMRRFHQAESHEAERVVEVLPLDEAEKTVGDYNKKFARKRGRYFSRP